MGSVKQGEGKRWRIIGIYAEKDDMERILGDFETWTEEREEGVLMVGKDFNARTWTEGGEVGKAHDWRKSDEERRRSKDKKIDKEGKMLVGF